MESNREYLRELYFSDDDPNIYDENGRCIGRRFISPRLFDNEGNCILTQEELDANEKMWEEEKLNNGLINPGD